MVNNDKTKLTVLENDLVELLKLFYRILDECYEINPKHTLTLYEALLESIQNRIKLLSQNQHEVTTNETGNGIDNGKA